MSETWETYWCPEHGPMAVNNWCEPCQAFRGERLKLPEEVARFSVAAREACQHRLNADEIAALLDHVDIACDDQCRAHSAASKLRMQLARLDREMPASWKP